MNSSRSRQATKRQTGLLTLTIVLVSVAIAGCGSSSSSTTSTKTTPTSAPASTSPSSSSSTAGGGQKLSLEANPEGQFKYNPSSLTAKAGSITIDFTNMAPLAHNLTIESATGARLGATPTFQGGTKMLTLNLKPGTYKYFCTVPGHRMAGMEGTLTVK